jgi:hypothetical protein
VSSSRRTRSHHIDTSWGDGLDTSAWSVGTHTVTVTVTDSTGAVGTASVKAVVTADKLAATAPGSVVPGKSVRCPACSHSSSVKITVS